MPTLDLTRTIAAPPARVFRTVADISEFSKAIPHIVKVEFLTERRSGVGTRFRETRLMKGKEASTELEVTEYEENERIRLVADSHGAVWDTVFTVTPAEGGTELRMAMEARPRGFAARLMIPLVMGMLRGALEQDMDAVKAFCEAPEAGNL